jgi:S1-C subfamily serine protease
MARTPLYSHSSRNTRAAAPAARAEVPAADAPPSASAAAKPPGRLRGWLQRRERWLWAAAALALATVAGWPSWNPRTPKPLTLAQVDAAMRESIAKEPLASAAAAAYEAIRPSVVRVVGEQEPEAAAPAAEAGSAAQRRSPARPGGPAASAPAADDPHGEERGRSVGTGVVIVDKGLILTNLHVVAGAKRIRVTFSDGQDSEAVLVSTQPEHDLAVLQARTLPDDLIAATMRSTQGLAPGDEVVAVGFPFGIGPSASSGVVSGLKREFRSPEGQRILTNLIQFDAAANPGNSGGPLVTLDGHVVGIVTAIMNPNRQRTFIGIGFAVPIENAAAGAGLPPF